MANKSQGRGLIAFIGFIVLFAGLLGAVVLWILADREPNRAAENFARAAPGCTTTITIAEPGEYYVFQELSGVITTVNGCVPSVSPGIDFAFELVGPDGEPVRRRLDSSLSYDLPIGEATSVASVEITQAGSYQLSVVGNDPAVVAVVGGDPAANVGRLRLGSWLAGIVGVVLGATLLVLSGRRSRRAAVVTAPVDPGWGVTERDHERRAAAQLPNPPPWPPQVPTVQVPVNPHLPDEHRVPQGQWAPPTVDGPAPSLPSSQTAHRPPAPDDEGDVRGDA